MNRRQEDENRRSDLFTYLKSVPRIVLDSLYYKPATCLTIFRELPPLSQQFVMRLLFIEHPVSQSVLASWVTLAYQTQLSTSTKVLTDLRIWHEVNLPGGQLGWKLNSTFQAQLKIALVGGDKPSVFIGPLAPDKYARDSTFLKKYAMERWEWVLRGIVGSLDATAVTEELGKDFRTVLENSGLVKKVNGGEWSITQAGFHFLLLDTASQVWQFMVHLLDNVQALGLSQVECLTMLFQLSYFEFGKEYSTSGLSDGLQNFLQRLREMGLVYQRKRSSQRFYPTQLAVNLVCGLSHDRRPPVTVEDLEGYVVVETNYRIYAYTESDLQVALLALFTEIQYRFPNLTVAMITRESVREALTRGITAEQIISFLRSHAHPQMHLDKPVLPPTITDQIRLWELERDRFRFTEGVLYNHFLSQSDFDLLRNYAKDAGLLTWSSAPGQPYSMVVTKAGHDDVRHFWKRNKKDS